MKKIEGNEAIKSTNSPEERLNVSNYLGGKDKNPKVNLREQIETTASPLNQDEDLEENKFDFKVSTKVVEVQEINQEELHTTSEADRERSPIVKGASPEADYLTMKRFKRCENCERLEDQLQEAQATIKKLNNKLDTIKDTLLIDLVSITDSVKSTLEMDNQSQSEYVPETKQKPSCQRELLPSVAINPKSNSKKTHMVPIAYSNPQIKKSQDKPFMKNRPKACPVKKSKPKHLTSTITHSPPPLACPMKKSQTKQSTSSVVNSSPLVSDQRCNQERRDSINDSQELYEFPRALAYTKTLIVTENQFKFLMLKSKSFTCWKKLVNSIMTIMFTEDQMANCSAQGMPNQKNQDQECRPALPNLTVEEIIAHIQNKFKDKHGMIVVQRNEITKTVNTKCESIRRKLRLKAMKKSGVEDKEDSIN
ncbi:uncharacterized protein [Clytia hemisphaerica]|uniref:uncharacterized protein n=1 Tax=Clytia hemisphaerica TaxID=252671 RepID=UPI0034D4C1AC